MTKENNNEMLISMSREALDELPFGAYVINKKGVIEFFNKEMANISGVKESKKIEGQNVNEVPSYEKYGLLRFIKRGLEGQPFRVKGIQYVSHVGKKESYRDYYGIPIKNEKGETDKLLCIVEDMTKQRELEAQVVADLREKDILLNEIHHRVKSNMQVISKMMNLQLAHIEDEKTAEMLKEGKNQIKSMLMVHDKLYQVRNLSEIDFREYITDLIKNLFDMYNIDRDLVSARIEIADTSLSLDQAIPCALIINELAANSLKYAFPDKKKGEIIITLQSFDDDNYELMVGDNGVGFRSMADISSSNSLGIALVNTLTKDIKGELNIADQGGIKARIKFPKML